MKSFKKPLALMVMAGLPLVSAMADAANQGSGRVQFTGSIIDAPCSIDPTSTDQKVNLGSVAKHALKGGGTSEMQSFSIKLKQCDFSGENAKNKAQLTFTGQSATQDNKYLAINGEASGAGVYMRTTGSNGQEDIVLGKPTSGVYLSGESPELQIQAQLKGVSDSIVPGAFDAVTNFEISYN